MRNLRLNRSFFNVLCLAVIGLIFLSVGGQYLHAAIHDHHDDGHECLFSHFFLQVFIACIGVAFVFFFKKRTFLTYQHQKLLSKTGFSCLNPRAPPVSA